MDEFKIRPTHFDKFSFATCKKKRLNIDQPLGLSGIQPDVYDASSCEPNEYGLPHDRSYLYTGILH